MIHSLYLISFSLSLTNSTESMEPPNPSSAAVETTISIKCTHDVTTLTAMMDIFIPKNIDISDHVLDIGSCSNVTLNDGASMNMKDTIKNASNYWYTSLNSQECGTDMNVTNDHVTFYNILTIRNSLIIRESDRGMFWGLRCNYARKYNLTEGITSFLGMWNGTMEED